MAKIPAPLVIHHIDDEWTVEWIAGSLFDYCREHYPDMTEDDYREESSLPASTKDSDSPLTVHIVVRESTELREIEYRRYDLGGFDLTAATFAPNDVVILDLGLVTANREVRPVGVDHLRNLLQRHASQRVFVLTGYHNLLPKDLGGRLPDGHIFYKPTDAFQFIRAIAQALDLR